MARPLARVVRQCGWTAVITYLLLAFGLLGSIVVLTHGHFSYSLDDPYIHLALAERIRHGLYGLNAGEPVSPSSSVLWPLLFVPFAGTRVFIFMPLVVNLAAGGLSAWLLGRFVAEFILPRYEERTGTRALLLCALLVCACSLAPLSLTGMEHGLEVLLCLACAYGIVCVVYGRAIPVWCVAAAVVAPSVRYEAILCTGALAVAVWTTGEKKKAGLLFALSIVPLLLFSAFLHHLRLPPFPISVLNKAHADIPSSPLARAVKVVGRALGMTLLDSERWPQTLIAVALGYFAWKYRGIRRIGLPAAGAALACFGQVLAGPVGWNYRYEMYIVAFGLTVALALASLEVTTERNVPRYAVPGILLLGVAAVALAYGRALVLAPLSAQSIYRQQWQMSRFTHEYYTGPVAVNDLGLQALGRDPKNYILDLAALGSLEVFKVPKPLPAAAMQQLTAEHHIPLAMIYTEWFPVVPSTWTPLAAICSDMYSSTASARVVFYLTDPATQPQIEQAIHDFSATLPAADTIVMHPANVNTACAKEIADSRRYAKS